MQVYRGKYRDICKNRRFTIWSNFIEVARALPYEICQTTAIRSRLKQCKIRLSKSGVKIKNDSETNRGERFKTARFKIARFKISRFKIARFKIARFKIARFKIAPFKIARFFQLSAFECLKYLYGLLQ